MIAAKTHLPMHLIGTIGYINYEDGDDVATRYSKFTLIIYVTNYMIDIPILYIYYVKDQVLCLVY